MSLPPEYQAQVNELRVVIQREGTEGACLGAAKAFPIQVAPDSHLVVRKDDSLPVQFGDLPRYLSGGFEVLLAEELLDSEDGLLLLARLSADLSLPVDFRRVRFLEESQPLRPRGPFLALGRFEAGGLQVPVRFDKGSIRVVDDHGSTLLDAKTLPRLTVAQLARTQQGARGLWVRTASGERLPPPDDFKLSEDDVAFADRSGVLLTLDSGAPSQARVHYPGVTSWLGHLGANRFWILALGWLGLTLLVLYLYRKIRQHDPDRKRGDGTGFTSDPGAPGNGHG
ncbi:hypothetical protein [Thiohalorhabdus methylotrophus]|uniref:SURF1-like protein n=1 Tax=Thiohalorhabdus methylotrophus TaxID=3242694 RepID=A0ABV4TT43_9GAMM